MKRVQIPICIALLTTITSCSDREPAIISQDTLTAIVVETAKFGLSYGNSLSDDALNVIQQCGQPAARLHAQQCLDEARGLAKKSEAYRKILQQIITK